MDLNHASAGPFSDSRTKRSWYISEHTVVWG